MNKSLFKILNSLNGPLFVTICGFFMLAVVCAFVLKDWRNDSDSQTTLAVNDQHVAIALIDEINIFKNNWVFDPIDERAAYNIIQLKHKQSKIRKESLEHLVKGIDELFKGRAYIVAYEFTLAKKSPYVENLADNILTKPLAAYENEASDIAASAKITGRCPSCGDTELMDCPHPTAWKLFGYLPCKVCNGDGVIRHTAKHFRETGEASTICNDCKGRGTTPCPTCNAKQFIACDVCHFDLQNRYDDQSLQALLKLRQIANHLMLNGGDLYSNEAFNSAP